MDTFGDNQVLRIEIRQPDRDHDTPDAHSTSSSAQLTVKVVTAEQVMRLISGRNVQLLQIIKQHNPQSLAELARLSNRPTASLTRTLQRLSALGIVSLRRTKGREKVPVVACNCLRFELPLTGAEEPRRQAAE